MGDGHAPLWTLVYGYRTRSRRLGRPPTLIVQLVADIQNRLFSRAGWPGWLPPDYESGRPLPDFVALTWTNGSPIASVRAI